MLKLIKCEFLKLKRKKFIPLIILAAFLFPIPLTYLMTTPSMMERYTDQADAFDGLFNMVLGYGTAVTESDESDAAKILELLKNPETAALLKQLAKAL